MTNLVSTQKARVIEHNGKVLAKLENMGKPGAGVTRAEQGRIDALRKTLKSVPSLAYLKSVIPGVPLVLSGSSNMDTQAAQKLIELLAGPDAKETAAYRTVLKRLIGKPGESATSVARRRRSPTL